MSVTLLVSGYATSSEAIETLRQAEEVYWSRADFDTEWKTMNDLMTRIQVEVKINRRRFIYRPLYYILQQAIACQHRKPHMGGGILIPVLPDGTLDFEKLLSTEDVYLYKNNLYHVDSAGLESGEIELLVKEHYFKQKRRMSKLRDRVNQYEHPESNGTQRREHIPEEVRFAVWRRDGGRCVECGSNRDLEFDHIIPVSKGGSNTERNIRLLCEKCNREKSDRI